MIHCPKCSHEQSNALECEACGLVFRKFEQAQDRIRAKKEHEQLGAASGQAKATGMLVRVGLLFLLVAATAGTTYYFVQGTRNTPPVPPVTVPAPTVAAVPKNPAPEPARPEPVASPQKEIPVTGNAIEHAKNATVSIETPWGKGSGFFISDSIVVTNKHVVSPDQKQIEELRHKVETARRLIDLEMEKLAELRKQTGRMVDGPEREQMKIILKERENSLAKVLPEQEAAEARLKRMERPLSHTDIKVFLADGSEFTASSTQSSHKRDLALVTIYSAKATVLQPAAKQATLRQGDKVYTVGNPVGLRNTVTAGVFSGYREREDTKEVFLQTDAAINPGNSGGPLIDERGLVHGVNTMILQNTQGIGFAIPIQTVFEEFSLSPPSDR